MATHKIGNFKFNLSKKGFAFRMGDGEIHRLPFSKQDKDEGYSATAPEGSEYDAYSEEGSYYDEGYDEPAYDDRAYDDAGYDNGGYYEEEAPAEDDDYYAGDGYYGDGEEDGYDGAERDNSPIGRAMEFIESHLWIVSVLLVVLPPLGIYLLFKFKCYEKTMRYILAGVSAAWCIFLLFLIFKGFSSCGGAGDRSTPPAMSLTSVQPTATPEIEEKLQTPTPRPTALTDDLDAQPSPTPLNGGVVTGEDGTGSVSGTTNVYSPQTGLYYHTKQDCTMIDKGVSVSLVTLEAAKNRNQYACPLCGGGVMYYATPGGKYYHTDKECPGMTDAVEYSKEAAEAEGKTACPVCAGGKAQSESNSGKTQAQIYAESLTNDKSGVKVWMTSGGKSYHLKEHCSGMTGAKKVTLLKALQSGKPPCSTCCGALGNVVYCTSGGTWYHSNKNCKGMSNAKAVSLSAALVLGKKKCPTCVSDALYTSTDAGNTASSAGSSEVYVYATSNGKHYHTKENCNGMQNANRVTLTAALNAGRPACPDCCPNAEITVYGASGNKYYHSYATCSGIKNAKSGTLAKALSLGLKACPKCWKSGSSSNSSSSSNNSSSSAPAGNNTSSGSNASSSSSQTVNRDDGNNNYSGVYVYASENGKNYHSKKSCSAAESGVSRVLLEQAIDDGKTPCSVCASYANDTVYGASGNRFFHKSKSCSALQNRSGSIKSGTIAKAMLNGLTACPACYGSSSDSSSTPTPSHSNTYTSGKSGVSVYASTSDSRYHRSASCRNANGQLVKVSLETALNYHKSACTACANSANRTVYGTASGKYFHLSSSCAGSSAKSATLDKALALGLKACPNCVTGSSKTETTDKFISGTSGIKVYGKVGNPYYHTKRGCSGISGLKKVTLETAKNYGLTACPKCASAGNTKVYGVASTMTYHFDLSHAGSSAVSGTLDDALSYGMKPCTYCVIGEGDEGGGGQIDLPTDVPTGGNGGSADANSTVYMDLSGATNAFVYHKNSSCKDSGMSGGTPVTLEYALEQGFSSCSNCNPPTSVNSGIE